MTRHERLKLAKAARELAMECVEGTAPKFGTGRPFTRTDVDTFVPNCALGHVVARAGISYREWLGLGGSGFMGATAEELVWQANDLYAVEHRGAVVFPLLALADELESAP